MTRAHMIAFALPAILGGLSAGAGEMSRPFLINPEWVVAAQPTDQWDHRAASDGAIWLVVWADNSSFEIYGLRLDAQGCPLDAAAMPIAPNSVGQYATWRRYPAVAWQGGAFWVVWEEYRGSGLREGYGRRVFPDGTLADGAPFSVESATSSAYRSSVCAGATNLLLTWSTYSSVYRLWAQVCAPDGQLLGTATSLCAGFSSYVQPAMAFGDFATGAKSYLLTFALSNNIHGVRVSESGLPLDATPLSICTAAGTQAAPWPAFGAGPGGTQGWWVVWQDSRGVNDDLYGAFVAQDGAVSHSSTGTLLIAGDEGQTYPSLAWDGARYGLSWYDYREPPAVRATIMTGDGYIADTNGILVSTNEPSTPLVCARTNGSFLSVHGSDSVFIETLAVQDSTLTAGTQRLVSMAGAYEQYNSAAGDGTNYWTAFAYHPAEAERSGDIAVQCVTAGGQPVFPAPIMVCTNRGDQWGPALAIGRNALWVVWADTRNGNDQIWGQRLTRSGELVGTNAPIGTSTLYAYFCDIASDGTNFLAVWNDSGGNRIQGRILNADGSLGGVLTPLNYDCSDPFVTFGGGCYLVLGADNSASTRYVRFRRYSPGGTAIDGGASNLYSSASPVWDPRAAYNPGNHQFLVTWRDQATYQVLGRTLDAATAARGNIMTALVFNTWGSSDNAGVAYDGANWLCLFADNRGGAPGLFGTRVDSAGAVLDPTPFPVLYGGSSGELAAPIAPDTNTLILGAKQVYRVNGKAYNTRKNVGIFWSPGAPVVPGCRLECEPVQLDACGQTLLEFAQTAPASTGYVAESCATLPNQVWQPATNCALLDSAVSVMATWREPGGAGAARCFRIRGE